MNSEHSCHNNLSYTFYFLFVAWHRNINGAFKYWFFFFPGIAVALRNHYSALFLPWHFTVSNRFNSMICSTVKVVRKQRWEKKPINGNELIICYQRRTYLGWGRVVRQSLILHRERNVITNILKYALWDELKCRERWGEKLQVEIPSPPSSQRFQRGLKISRSVLMKGQLLHTLGTMVQSVGPQPCTWLQNKYLHCPLRPAHSDQGPQTHHTKT